MQYLSFISIIHPSHAQTKNTKETPRLFHLEHLLDAQHIHSIKWIGVPPHISLLLPAHPVPGSSRKGTRAGSGALLLQTYRCYNPGNIWSIQHKDTTTEQEQKYSCLSNTSTLGVSDFPLASLLASSEKQPFQGWGIGSKGHFPLTLSKISGEEGQKKMTHIRQKP